MGHSWVTRGSHVLGSEQCRPRPGPRPAVLLAYRTACEQHSSPASTLTDKGMVFTTRLAGGRGGRNALEHELRRLGIKRKNGNHPEAVPRNKVASSHLTLGPSSVSTEQG